MGILFIQTDEPGQITQPNIRRVKIITTDNLATVTTAGYLNDVSLQGYAIYNTDTIDMWYGAVGVLGLNISSPGTYAKFTASISNGVITLVEWTDPGNVLLPVVNGNLPEFNGITGQIKDSNISASNLMLLNTANTMAAGSSIVAAKVNGTEAANAVTASGMSGVITTSSLTTAGGSSYAITWTNTFITATSTILLTIMGGTNTTENITLKATAGSGSSTLTIYNNTAATALNGTILIGYLVI